LQGRPGDVLRWPFSCGRSWPNVKIGHGGLVVANRGRCIFGTATFAYFRIPPFSAPIRRLLGEIELKTMSGD
jgi:hypothetical protein